MDLQSRFEHLEQLFNDGDITAGLQYAALCGKNGQKSPIEAVVKADKILASIKKENQTAFEMAKIFGKIEIFRSYIDELENGVMRGQPEEIIKMRSVMDEHIAEFSAVCEKSGY